MSELDTTTRDDRAEYAYAVWSTEAGGDTAKTAAITGIPRSSIQRWRKQDDWDKRLDIETFADTAQAVERAAQMVRAAMPQVMERMIGIVIGTKPQLDTSGHVVINPDTGKVIMIPIAENKDSINAARWLMQYGMMSAYDVLKEGSSGGFAYDTPWGSAGPDSGPKTPVSAREQSRDILNAQYAMSNTRKAGRGR